MFSRRGAIRISVLLIGFFLLGFLAFYIYPRMGSGRQATYEAQVLSSAQAGIRALYESGDFSHLSNRIANQADFFPEKMEKSPTAIINQFGGMVQVSGSTAQGFRSAHSPAPFFRIKYMAVPPDICMKLAPSLAQNFEAVLIGVDDKTMKSFQNELLNQPIRETELSAFCTQNQSVTMIFISTASKVRV